ncbi:MAG: CRISPR-associated endonuclease Cas6, partial [Candidatus Bathyarchaeota archaeon]|nr:CRISPR-associated endonuclease Cas6 [Candidatus Bathyarchaeota archaeon]
MDKNSEVPVEICRVYFTIDKPISATQMRGYFGRIFIDTPEFHHHTDRSYHYPLIQYKIVEDTPIILGINKYARILYNKIMPVDYMIAHSHPYTRQVTIKRKHLKLQTETVKAAPCTYQFTTPWIALNQMNYSLYKASPSRHLLEEILTANILSLLKGLSIHVNYKIKTKIHHYKPTPITVHNNKFIGFYALFTANITLPSHLGLGKSVTKGYGTIQQTL